MTEDTTRHFLRELVDDATPLPDWELIRMRARLVDEMERARAPYESVWLIQFGWQSWIGMSVAALALWFTTIASS